MWRGIVFLGAVCFIGQMNALAVVDQEEPNLPQGEYPAISQQPEQAPSPPPEYSGTGVDSVTYTPQQKVSGSSFGAPSEKGPSELHSGWYWYLQERKR
ncbi:MAG: hypothetical protein HY211_05115 [Candidatus Omnitrophica bacterium]|nr:hypothetical protein [Candidatus Omnitrophota bacterium]